MHRNCAHICISKGPLSVSIDIWKNGLYNLECVFGLWVGFGLWQVSWQDESYISFFCACMAWMDFDDCLWLACFNSPWLPRPCCGKRIHSLQCRGVVSPSIITQPSLSSLFLLLLSFFLCNFTQTPGGKKWQKQKKLRPQWGHGYWLRSWSCCLGVWFFAATWTAHGNGRISYFSRYFVRSKDECGSVGDKRSCVSLFYVSMAMLKASALRAGSSNEVTLCFNKDTLDMMRYLTWQERKERKWCFNVI